MSKKSHHQDPSAMPTPDTSHIQVGRTPLEDSIVRAQKILRTYAADRGARGFLVPVGFTPAVYEEGWMLLRRAYGETAVQPPPPPNDAVLALVERAATEGASVFGRVHAVLHRFDPAQEAIVFAGNLSASSGFEAVVALQTLLDRLDALEQGGPEHKDTHKQDLAAIQAIASRGVTRELRKELRHLCASIESAPTSVGTVTLAPAPEPPNTRAARLRDLYAWVQDWSEMASATISDKRILRRMGIGKRRARSAKGPVVNPPSVPAPVPAPPPSSPLPAFVNGVTQGGSAHA